MTMNKTLQLSLLMLAMISLLLPIIGNSCYGQNEVQESLNYWTEKIAETPNDEMAYLQRGYVYFQINDYEKAAKDLQNTLVINPQNYNALFLVAQILLEQREFKQVYQFANEAIKFNPKKDPNFYLIRAYGYEGAEEYVKAKADYETVLSLNPESDEAKERLAIVNPKSTAAITNSSKQELADLELAVKILNYRQDEYDVLFNKTEELALAMATKMKVEKITINDSKLKTEKAALKKEYLALLKIWDERITQFPKETKGYLANYELQVILKRMDLINDWEKLTGEDIYK